MKELIAEEKESNAERLKKILEDFNVEFTGTAYDKNAKQSEEENEDENLDPYNQLGYGFIAYFNSMHIFGWIFLLLTVLMLPAYGYYI
jgi:hypothetical protein